MIAAFAGIFLCQLLGEFLCRRSPCPFPAR